MNELGQTIALERANQHQKALEIVLSDNGHEVMEQILAVISHLKYEQDRMVRDQFDVENETVRQSTVTVMFGNLMAFCLVVLASLLTHHELRGRKKAEDERDSFFTMSLDMLCIAGMDGYFKLLNPSFEALLGFTTKELTSKPILSFIHPDDILATQQEIARQAAGDSVLFFENRYLCKDGSYRWLSWKSVPVGDKMYATARDVTETKRIEQDLIRARQAALESSRVKSEFLANMSHEIRTPLNGIIGMTDLLLETTLIDIQRRYATIVQESGQALLWLINSILDFSKIEAGKMDFEHIEFNPGHLVEQQCMLMSAKAKEKNLTLTTIVDPNVPTHLLGDSSKLAQVLLNLISNAIKFTEKGSVVVQAAASEISDSSVTLLFGVRDTGIGISSTDQTRLFQPFTQADGSTARKFGGTGLGLSISKKIVEMMQGQIGVESTPGEGSTFWFNVTFDLADQKSSQTPSRLKHELASSPAKSSEQAADLKTMRAKILVVEDNLVNQLLAVTQLESLGYTTVAVANGFEAITAYQKGNFDLILMDCQMPEMDGFQATQAIRKMEQSTTTHIPIIALTANAMQPDHEQCLAAGMDDYLAKPFKKEKLMGLINHWLNQNLKKTA